MKITKMNTLTFLLSFSFLTGCATWQQSAGVAAAGCGAAGAIVGALTKNAGWGAATGAGCLGVSALVIYVDYQNSQSRTVSEDMKLYGYKQPLNNTEVKIRNASASPNYVTAGDKLKVNLDYSVMAPQGTQKVAVTETMTLKQNGSSDVKELSNRSVDRQLGGASSEVDFTIPKDMPTGNYVIEQRIQAGTSYETKQTMFSVRA